MEIKANEFLFLCYGKDLPPTVNSNYRSTGKQVYKTARAKAWEETLQWRVKQAYQNLPIFYEGPFHVIFFWGKNRADIDNRLKSALDAMNRVVYRDDSDIKSLVSIKVGGSRSFLCCVSLVPLGDLFMAADKVNSCAEVREIIERTYLI